MILSHEHRTVFVKTRKTAGTSIELALSAVCGPRDVITPLGPRDEPTRTAAGHRGPQNHRGSRLRRRPAAWNHMPVTEILRLVDRRTWDAYLTFAVERNPWDRAVSLYAFRQSKGESRPFGEFLRAMPTDRLSNFGVYSLDGAVAVDRVLRYEDLDAELDRTWKRVGIVVPGLSHAKSGHRRDRDFRELYTEDDAALVGEVCAREIALLGYEFAPAG